MTDQFTPALARCHQHSLPIIDAVGRVITEGMWVRARRGPHDPIFDDRTAGPIIHLFNFDDYHPPEIEWCCEHPELDRPVITSSRASLTGGCWKFTSLLATDRRGDG